MANSAFIAEVQTSFSRINLEKPKMEEKSGGGDISATIVAVNSGGEPL
jgi:hypothetical protein